ncbi:hypothetical protein HYC85_003083 [Camellia sinensis]|uniref:MLO-like protein n=1 Tax=Camellia sinensis TaxID=4442 RepID=A0A7J7IBR9_CAMSI|nr:hypothetical protein HYC85_003083 [Camellia sinensis]
MKGTVNSPKKRSRRKDRRSQTMVTEVTEQRKLHQKEERRQLQSLRSGTMAYSSARERKKQRNRCKNPNRFRFTRQTTFGRRHMTHCSDSTAHLWIKCFFRQFFKSVAKVDYLTLRHGFISAHLSERHNNFNFQKYIQRSLEEDFKVIPTFVVNSCHLYARGCSSFGVGCMAASSSSRGWHVYLFISFIPLLIVLVLGTKLEVIVARMALQLNNQDNVITGAPLVQPHDDLFWFGRPRFVLTLLHLTLFLNAFELAFFVWVTVSLFLLLLTLCFECDGWQGIRVKVGVGERIRMEEGIKMEVRKGIEMEELEVVLEK